MAYPEPTEVSPWYLRNITQALALDETTGNVYVRTNTNIEVGNANITVGNVGISSFGNIPISGNTLPVTVSGGNINAVVTGTVTSTLSGNLAGITGNVTIVDGGGAITVDGTVNIGTMPNVNATVSGNVGITGNVNIGTMPNVNASISGNVSTTIVGTNLDAFGRLRVSNPVTLFDSQNLYLDGQQWSQILAGTGTRTYVANESSFNLTVGTGATDSVITQSKFVQQYQPGKSLLVMNTFAMAAATANLTQRVGYFTANDGVYFEQVGSTLNMVIRSSASGSIVEDRVPQSSWNGDTLPSLDPTLVQIFWCDIEWLGVGNVRCGFVINGQFIVCHTFQHANMPGNTTVYMTTASLNPRYEIFNTGTTGFSATMKQICSTVISEGGYTPATTINYVSNGTNVTRVSAANTVTSLCSIRLNPSYPDAVVIPAQLDMLMIDVRYGQFVLVENATIANAVFSNVANSVVQTAVHTDTITDGTVLYAGLVSSREAVLIGDDVAKRLQLWRYANGTPSTLTLAVSYTQTNSDLLWKLGWEELTN